VVVVLLLEVMLVQPLLVFVLRQLQLRVRPLERRLHRMRMQARARAHAHALVLAQAVAPTVPADVLASLSYTAACCDIAPNATAGRVKVHGARRDGIAGEH
jgi:hypothetical protein